MFLCDEHCQGVQHKHQQSSSTGNRFIHFFQSCADSLDIRSNEWNISIDNDCHNNDICKWKLTFSTTVQGGESWRQNKQMKLVYLSVAFNMALLGKLFGWSTYQTKLVAVQTAVMHLWHYTPNNHLYGLSSRCPSICSSGHLHSSPSRMLQWIVLARVTQRVPYRLGLSQRTSTNV